MYLHASTYLRPLPAVAPSRFVAEPQAVEAPHRKALSAGRPGDGRDDVGVQGTDKELPAKRIPHLWGE
jgi:hypothetical protein